MTMRCPTRLALLPLLAGVALVTGCGDDAPAEDDTGTSTSGADTGMMTTAMTTAMPDTGRLDTTTDTPGTDSGDTGPGTTGTDGGSSGDDSGSGSSSSGGVAGTCVGVDFIGNINTVFGLDGANPGGPCDERPAPCGGDIVGSWTFDDTCGLEQFPNPVDCEQSSFSIENTELTGTIEFVDDNTFTQMSSSTTLTSLTVEAETCFDINCAAFEAQLQGENADWTCEFNDPDCECTLTGTEETDISGTWETNGNVVTVTVDGTEADIDYCVNNNRLDFWQPLNDVSLTEEMCADAEECEAALGDMHDSYVCI